MTTVRTQPTRPVTDPRRSTRWLAALVIPVGPAAVALLRFVLPYDTTDDPATMVAKVVAHPGTQSLVVWLGLLAMLTLVPGALWVGRLTRRHAPRTTAAAMLLLIPGYLSMFVLVGTDIVLWAGAAIGLDEATLTRLAATEHPTIAIAAGIFVVGHVLGTVLLGIALWNSRAVPRATAVLVAVSQPVHFVAAVVLVSHTLDLVGWGMQAAGFIAAAWAITRLADSDWDLPPRSSSPTVTT